MLEVIRFLTNLSGALVVLVCCLVIPYFYVVSHFSKELGRYALLGDLNRLRKKGRPLASFGYWSAWAIYLLGVLLVFPPVILALNR